MYTPAMGEDRSDTPAGSPRSNTGAEAFITSESNPRVKRVVRLRKSAGSAGRRATGLLLAEGAREVARAVAAGLTVEEVFVCGERADTDTAAAADAAERAGARRVEVADKVLRKMTYHREPEGVLAVVRRPTTSLDALPPVEATSLWLVAVGTEKPGNLGAMVRTADAAGCAAVIAAGAPVDPFHPNAIRASTGAVFTMPVATCGEQEAAAALRKRGLWIWAMTVDAPRTLREANAPGPAAVVIGPEDVGLGPLWRASAEECGGAAVRIETRGRTADSLNASVAAGVALFALRSAAAAD